MKKLSISFLLSLLFSVNIFAQDRPEATEVWTPAPPVVTAGATPQEAPSDAIILFDGKDLSKWTDNKQNAVRWKSENGAMTAEKGTGDIQTRQAFGSCQLHIEWRTPKKVVDSGQNRGNSGIFLMGQYELQVLDSYNNKTYSNGQAGSIYKQSMPLVNVCRPAGEWQIYDIIFTAPKFDENNIVVSPARITVFQNGVVIQNHVEVKGKTVYTGKPSYTKHKDKEYLVLQEHGSPVSYRNIWLREL